MRAAELIIISGVSGSGKSVALDALEDMGFFCIDNLPSPLMGALVDFLCSLPDSWVSQQTAARSGGSKDSIQPKFALLIDCRDDQSFPQVMTAVARLKSVGTTVSLLYLDCQDNVVIRRYQETRRPHPLLLFSGENTDTPGKRSGDNSGNECCTVAEAVRKERTILAEFRGTADQIVDTSSTSPHELRRIVENYVGHKRSIEIVIESFGFKYGAPGDADLIADVRFLPNPHFVQGLRERTGEEEPVKEYVFKSSDAIEFVNRYTELLSFLIPKYKTEGKRYLTIAIGCTGGKHRSVAIAAELRARLAAQNIRSSIRHRDLARSG